MNVIFIDFDGPINTLNSVLEPKEPENAKEKRIKILSEICRLNNSKVVIESAHKDMIDEKTLEILVQADWLLNLFNLFKKYDIEIIGRTPIIKKNFEGINYNIVKEEEIKKYLDEHKDIEHICVIDDDDLVTIPERERGDFSRSDLNMFREYLISPLIYSDIDPNLAGLQEYHIEEANKIFQKTIKR